MEIIKQELISRMQIMAGFVEVQWWTQVYWYVVSAL